MSIGFGREMREQTLDGRERLVDYPIYATTVYMRNTRPDMALELNPYLTSAASGSKGGGLFTENPAAVENIIFQTRGEPLTAFEDRLAEQLMAVFSTGAVELADVVAAMNAEGAVDDLGRPWTVESLPAVLSDLGGQVFGVSEDRA